MLEYSIKVDPKTNETYLETPLSGKALLGIPQLNKGMAFTLEERHTFGLLGKLPSRLETLEEQVERAYSQGMSYQNALNRNIYLNNLHDKNQIVFYKLISEHLQEFIPIIYTPTVGEAVTSFSRKYRHARGIYLSYPERAYIDEILDNRSNPEIDVICLTDGEAVLGIGDQGIGAMEIPIAKLMVYTVCGGINPSRTLPIMLDVGTDNPELLNDPHYLGWRHPRLRGKEYDDFIETVVQAIHRTLPKAFIHWEDFGTKNAHDILHRYQNRYCTFNDDIQGTGVTALATLLAATKALNQDLADQRIIIFGAGAAGMGIANQIIDDLIHSGLSAEDAHRRIWLVDRFGLIHEGSESMNSSQVSFARPLTETQTWKVENSKNINLLETVYHVKPTVLIGCSAQAGMFTEVIVKTMASHVKHPIILPLSNPTARAEAKPADLIEWTNGHVLVATGSPFDPVEFKGKTIMIAQCNNARAFPAIGLAMTVGQPRLLTNTLLLAASHALAECAPVQKNIEAALLPSINESEHTAKYVAKAIILKAIQEGLSTVNPNEIDQLLNRHYWKPAYLPYRRAVE